ncbi:PepSY domain-containing protein [Micrococcus lylae]|uniref:PepSY domain-containing protein n=1 Tax=Micrococcus lylae TaxID=1273 RepID=UPI0015E08561|nr:PepSY domain-containing protein [Micrococcus lylae]WIK82433.1 PepSY domain-containing protein [Micrococcus lylae]
MQKTLTQKLTLTGTGILAVLALSACGASGDSEAGDSIELQDNPSSSAPAQADSSGDADDDASDNADDKDDSSSASSAASSSSAGSSAAGTDPAFDAIDAVKGTAADAIVLSLDRDDDDTMWDVEAVEGEETVEYDVTQDGEVTETEREADKDDADKANRAEVSIDDAISTALEGRDGQTVDDVELDEEDGTLVWEIDFDDADGNDADKVYVDAVTGDIVKG